MEIKTVAILGANGSMGSGSAGIIASFGDAKVFMIARSIEKAINSIEKAAKSIRSSSINIKMTPATYEDLPKIIPNCDWIFEAVPEDFESKVKILNLLNPLLNQDAIVSSVTSGLSIEKLGMHLSENNRKRFFGVHFFNPPYKMPLCEFVSPSYTDKVLSEKFEQYLAKKLLRRVVKVNDTAAFLGNRIGFVFLNEAVLFADKYSNQGGIWLIDEILCGITGRAMPPLLTVDFVGLDIHHAIVKNLSQNIDGFWSKSFAIPKYFDLLINNNKLGAKTKEGLYKKIKIDENNKKLLAYDIQTGTYIEKPSFNIHYIAKARGLIRDGLYKKAIDVILTSGGFEADICRYFLGLYISFSMLAFTTAAYEKEDSDRVMGYGFNWIPPSALVDLLGGVDLAIKLLEETKFPVPECLVYSNTKEKFYQLYNELDPRRFLKAN